MYVPGYRPGITSPLETEIQDITTHLTDNTQYLSTWSDIITYNDGNTTEFKGCTGLFDTPENFESLEERCQSEKWLRGSTYFQNNGSSSTKINLKFDLKY